MWTVGLLLSGNAAGLTLEEYLSLDEAGRDAARAGRRRAVRRRAALPDRHGGRPAGGDLRTRGWRRAIVPEPACAGSLYHDVSHDLRGGHQSRPRDLHQSFPLIHGVHMNRYKLPGRRPVGRDGRRLRRDHADGLHRAGSRPDPEPYQAAFEKPTPTSRSSGCDSTGIITAKLLAEKKQPQGRRHLGPGRHLAGPDGQGRRAAYAPKGLDQIAANMRDAQGRAHLGRHGRLRRRHLLQHRRGRQAAQAPRRGRT